MAEPEQARRPQRVSAGHPLLRRLLARGYVEFTEDSGPRHLVLPATTSVGFVVKLDDSPHRPPAFVMGSHGRHEMLDGACAPAYLEVWMRPLGAYTLLGVPMDELCGRVVDLADVCGPAGTRLVEQVRATRNWGRRCALVDRLLLDRLDRGREPSPEVGRAWTRLVDTGGGVPIGRIAAEVGWSHKHLITKFRREVGLSPKTVARLLRLDRVWAGLDRRRGPRWERIAAEAGYADQAHLIRDFREFTGLTPAAFWSRVDAQRRDPMVNSVQDPGPLRS